MFILFFDAVFVEYAKSLGEISLQTVYQRGLLYVFLDTIEKLFFKRMTSVKIIACQQILGLYENCQSQSL